MAENEGFEGFENENGETVIGEGFVSSLTKVITNAGSALTGLGSGLMIGRDKTIGEVADMLGVDKKQLKEDLKAEKARKRSEKGVTRFGFYTVHPEKEVKKTKPKKAKTKVAEDEGEETPKPAKKRPTKKKKVVPAE